MIQFPQNNLLRCPSFYKTFWSTKHITSSSSVAPLQTTDILFSVHVSEASESDCKTTLLCQKIWLFFFHASRVATASIEVERIIQAGSQWSENIFIWTGRATVLGAAIKNVLIWAQHGAVAMCWCTAMHTHHCQFQQKACSVCSCMRVSGHYLKAEVIEMHFYSPPNQIHL